MIKTELEIDVRYYETDQMGIVHHSNYIRYFECGRIAMLKELGLPMEKIEEAGIMMPVVGVECRYKVPAKFGDVLKIVTTVDELPRAKMTIRSDIYNPSGDFCCAGAVTIGFIDAQTRRAIRCPEAFLSIFREHIKP
jgi:acyl-CoA thioester hydrolase